MVMTRFRGALVGLAVGDALGTTLEFHLRDLFPPLTDMIGGGPFDLPAGHWTDDTSMALCLAESLIECGGFDAVDQMRRYLRWYREGEAAARAADSSRTTHAADEAVDACRWFAALLVGALNGVSKQQLLAPDFAPEVVSPAIAAIRAGSYKTKTRAQIKSSGYVVHTLEAALWAFHATDTFREGALLAVNLGDDADTVGAVYGQIAGAHYGVEAIPAEWVARLYRRDDIVALADRLRTSSSG